MRNTAHVTGKSIAVLLQSISGVSAINPLLAFYNIHGGKREVLFFYFIPDTTRDNKTNIQRYKNNLNCLYLSNAQTLAQWIRVQYQLISIQCVLTYHNRKHGIRATMNGVHNKTKKRWAYHLSRDRVCSFPRGFWRIPFIRLIIFVLI
jgi:hypothetical protein